MKENRNTNNWSGVTSDNAANCNKAQSLLVEYDPRILNMADTCHNLHNACKDIPEFKKVFFLFLWFPFISVNLNLIPDNWSIVQFIGFYEPFILHFGLFWRGSWRLTHQKRFNINQRDEIWVNLLVSQLCFGWHASLQMDYARTNPWYREWGLYFSFINNC